MTLARLLPRSGDAVPTAEPGDPLQDEGHVLLLGAWSLGAATSSLAAGCCPWPATSRRRCFSSRRRTASRSTIWSCAPPHRHRLPDHATWAGSVCTLLPLPVHSRRLPLSDPDELDTVTPLRTVTAPLASGTKADSLDIETALLNTPVPPTLLDSDSKPPAADTSPASTRRA
jgi:hypothetical protein